MDLVVNAPIKKYMRDCRAQQLRDHFQEHRALYIRGTQLRSEPDDLLLLPTRGPPKTTQDAAIQSVLNICLEMSDRESNHSLHKGIKRSFQKSFLWFEDEQAKVFRDIPESLFDKQGSVHERQLQYSHRYSNIYFGDIGRADLQGTEEEEEEEGAESIDFDE